MADGYGFTYSVDPVLVIDATSSRRPVIYRVKTRALSVHDDLEKYLNELGSPGADGSR
jgi:hypothetical protein